MTYFINFSDVGIGAYSYSEAIKWAKEMSIKHGTATIICEQMQHTEYFRRPVATRLWKDTYENGERVKREILNTRFSDKLGEEIPVEDWNKEVEEYLELHYPPNKRRQL